jgi:hypothetical protein
MIGRRYQVALTDEQIELLIELVMGPANQTYRGRDFNFRSFRYQTILETLQRALRQQS